MIDYKEFIETGAWIGRQQAFAVVASHVSAAQAASLKEMRDGRLFEKAAITWDQFCEEYAGITRQQADRLIAHYSEFGESYFRLSQLARISPETYRQIAGKIKDDVLEFEDEKIPLTARNVPRIRAALNKLRADLRTARVNAKERPPLTVREFRMRTDMAATEVQNAACMAETDAELEVFRKMCVYAREKWERNSDTVNRIHRP